jgi:hypothetical protein
MEYMLTLPDCKMTFVCGPVASGKTHLIKTWVASDNRHVIFDSTGEYIDSQHREVWASPKQLNDAIDENHYLFRVVYVPGLNREEDFEHVLNILWWKPVSKLLVCDEVADICPVSGTTDSMEMLLRFARKNKLGFLAASQRIADVSKLFTSGCRMVVLFQTNEARDLEAIESRWRCGNLVENLRPLLYNDNTEVTEQIPQAVIIEKGKKPYVYDFATQSIASTQGEQAMRSTVDDNQETDSGETLQHGDSDESPERDGDGSPNTEPRN